MVPNRFRTTIVVPCYNESTRMPFEVFGKFISTTSDILFCFVNDGGTDKTGLKLNELRIKYPKNVVVLSAVKNLGKAESIRTGIKYNSKNLLSEYVAFLDADLSSPI